MSQWKQIQQLEMRLLEQVDYLYDDNFPMDIRQVLAGWIESQDWDSAVNDESMASVMFTNLQTQLEKVRLQEQNFLQRHNMKIIQQQLQERLTEAETRISHLKDTSELLQAADGREVSGSMLCGNCFQDLELQ
ncbi:hypothetical protein GOODEAATRI_011513 [Goodea atripinnis]|uniref:STAT transcription factor protein interaction domain-containing protein n=1 Tax=Goodea atripinnis TaxID=208336 RepID=A0ABV0PX63_9TELE